MPLTEQDKAVNQPDRQAGAVSREEAIDLLARELHFKMEHLDPTEDADWEKLSERHRDFFRCCIRHLMLYGDLIRSALTEDDRR